MAVDYAAQQLMETSLRGVGRLWAANFNMASAHARWMGAPASLTREFDAAAAFLTHNAQPFGKPSFNLPVTNIGGQIIPVREEIVLSKPFADLLHFDRDVKRNDPKLLIVAPLSGHYATLLRGTVEGLLPHHDVYITDWRNARDVPVRAGRFDLSDYTQYVEDFIHHLGPETHVLAVCQPTVPVFAAISQMAERGAPDQPLSLTLMGGPIDTRHAQGDVNRFAKSKTIEWFKENMIGEVSYGFEGYKRKVYPGFMQLGSFMGMNLGRHIESHLDWYNDLRRGDGESAQRRADFYREYKAVLDLSEEFYITTVSDVFIEELLPKGQLVLRDQLVIPSMIRNTPIFTVEGERDDIAPPGQTLAAHGLASGLDATQHFHYLQQGAGHYGIFEGSKWRTEVSPRVAAFIRLAAVDKSLNYSEIPPDTRLIPPNPWRKTDPVGHPAPGS